jgi:Spy/CpxP family protein refolding chaperone
MRVRRAGIMVMLALGAGAAHLAAQQGQGAGAPRRLAAPSVEELKTALSLNPDQADKAGKIITKWEGETREAREVLTRNFQAMQAGGDVEALRGESMMAMQYVRERSEEMNNQIRGILTPEQNKAFDAWIAERAQRMRQGRPGGPPPAHR